MSEKIKLAVDCDDTIISYSQEYLAYLGMKVGRNYNIADFKTTQWPLHAGLTKDVFDSHVRDFFHTDDYLKLPPIPGARDSLLKLKELYELHVVTARPDFVIEHTQNSINLFFPNVFSDIHYTNTVTPKPGAIVRSKSDICKHIGAFTIIEDNPGEALNFVNNGYIHRKAYLLLSTPWAVEASLKKLHDRVYPMRTWENVEVALLSER